MGIHKNGCLDSSWFYIFIFYIQRLILKEEIKDVIKKDKRFFGEEKMKLPIKIVEEMVEKYPNDMELGSRVRWYINWLNETKSKDKEYNDKDKTWRP
jgi:hypothetical protein|tara:strand:- start:335 stop:625 length:291 start_codon:yes stop_codon:yes gene_type:complete